MTRRLALVLTLVLVVLAPTASADLYSKRQSIQSRLATAQQRLGEAQARASALEGQIANVTSEIRALEARVGDVSRRLDTLERDLALHRERLRRINELFELQTQRLTFLKREYVVARLRLERRLIAIYESGEPTTTDVVLSSTSFSEMLDQLDFVKQVADQDKEIAAAVHRSKVRMRIARARTKRTRVSVASATRAIAVRTDQVREVRNSLVARRGALSAARGQQQVALASARSSARAEFAEAQSLQASSAAIAAQIQAAQAAAAPPPAPPTASTASVASAGHVSSAGLIWPVSGPVVSPFGYRCLGGLCRMHEGIDIGASSGTPIHAAASGTVIFAGVQSGYGNIIIIDHGHGLATAYAHQSGFAVGGGHVSQGQVIGYVGCTGRCFGPHLHFEVRVNGSAVDPLGYL